MKAAGHFGWRRLRMRQVQESAFVCLAGTCLLIGLLAGCSSPQKNPEQTDISGLIRVFNKVGKLQFDRSDVRSMPKSAQRLLDELASRLCAASFAEQVLVEGHCGIFAVNESGDMTSLAPGEQLIKQCSFTPTEEYGRALGERLALAVREYLARRGVPADSIQIISYGTDRPIIEYPKDAKTAADWNHAASANNRVALRLVQSGVTQPTAWMVYELEISRFEKRIEGTMGVGSENSVGRRER